MVVALAAAALAACSGAAGPSLSMGPDGSPADSAGRGPTGTPAIGEIDHATGAADVVFRFEEGGGFVPMGFFATEAPIFTLYGDGTVIFRDATASPPPDRDGIGRMPPFRTVKLSEDEIQALLGYAVADGGLGVARAQYTGPGADLPTATFTISAAGQTKTVSVMALGMEREAGPDTPVLEALARLGEKVRSFGHEVDDEVAWIPDRWRGVLTPDAFNPPRDWPWPGVVAADFVQRAEPGAPQFPVRTMTPAEIDALGLDEIEGGFSGLSLTGPDGKVYLFALRPLFPDEAH
ncbi:MAG: hypothetical protein A2V84_07620 [Chloroflexi bacterium RBG_16_70_13]|nr:MAG: hypothetical protein A2V84_07620 [Chloroflexi bacterium RBG_16_70_13]